MGYLIEGGPTRHVLDLTIYKFVIEMQIIITYRRATLTANQQERKRHTLCRLIRTQFIQSPFIAKGRAASQIVPMFDAWVHNLH